MKIVTEPKFGFSIELRSIETSFYVPDDPDENGNIPTAVPTWEKFLKTQLDYIHDYSQQKLYDMEDGINLYNNTVLVIDKTSAWDKSKGESVKLLQIYPARCLTECGETHEPATHEHVAAWHDVCEMAKAAMTKKAESYWKKYGTSKLHCRTYWADR